MDNDLLRYTLLARVRRRTYGLRNILEWPNVSRAGRRLMESVVSAGRDASDALRKLDRVTRAAALLPRALDARRAEQLWLQPCFSGYTPSPTEQEPWKGNRDLNTDRWRRLESLCHAALLRPAGDRAAFLLEACGDDQVLRQERDSLL